VSTPLEAFSAGAFATGFALEAVPCEELVTGSAFEADGRATAIATGRLTGFVVVVVLVLVVEVVVTCVDVTGSLARRAGLVGGDASWRCGVELDDVVNVNTITRRSSGLDQITQCVLFGAWNCLILVLAG
jgi:hypothetical protein